MMPVGVSHRRELPEQRIGQQRDGVSADKAGSDFRFQAAAFADDDFLRHAKTLGVTLQQMHPIQDDPARFSPFMAHSGRVFSAP